MAHINKNKVTSQKPISDEATQASKRADTMCALAHEETESQRQQSMRQVSDKFIQFAHIGRPHGLKGAFFLKTEDRRTKWDGYKELLIETNEGFLLKKVLKSYLSGNCLALILEDFTTKEQIDALYNKKIYVHKSNIKVKKHEYLASELNGYQVYDKQKKLLGTVTGIVSFGAQDNLQIKTHTSKKEILFPFMEPFVISVDRENKSIEIIYVPEFFDEEEADPA